MSTGPFDIQPGPDGNLWVVIWPNASCGSRSSGAATAFSDPYAGRRPIRIADGPDERVWFTENVADQIGRFDVLALAHRQCSGAFDDDADRARGVAGGRRRFRSDTSGSVVRRYDREP